MNTSYLVIAGRVVTGAFFILAGVNKIVNYAETGQAMMEAGVTSILLPLVIALEIMGGAIVLLGREGRLVVLAAFALAGFTLLTNLLFHRFWALDGTMAQLELSLFFKNIVVVGALLMIAGFNSRKP